MLMSEAKLAADLLPEKVWRRLQEMAAARFFGRVTLIYENGRVVRSETLTLELHRENGNGGPPLGGKR